MNNKYTVFLALSISLFMFAGCSDVKSEANKLTEITMQQLHDGHWIGDYSVYAINFTDDTFNYEGSFSVYKQKDGSYTIDYKDENIVLQKLDVPKLLPGCKYNKVKWQIDYSHYVVDFPEY